jgi:hypothetical protein
MVGYFVLMIVFIAIFLFGIWATIEDSGFAMIPTIMFILLAVQIFVWPFKITTTIPKSITSEFVKLDNKVVFNVDGHTYDENTIEWLIEWVNADTNNIRSIISYTLAGYEINRDITIVDKYSDYARSTER